MKRIHFFLLMLGALVLVGQGCFGGGAQTTNVSGGLWRTTDYGATFAQLKALPQLDGVGSIGGVNVRDLAIDPSNPNVYYIATTGNGFFYTLNGGTTWQRPEMKEMREGEVLDIEVDPKNTCTLYAVKGSRLYKSTDCARSFSVIYTDGGSASSLTRVAVDWFNPQIVWLGNTNGDVLKSTDSGTNWVTSVRTGSPVFNIEISNADSRIVFIGTATRGLVRTEDTGATWKNLGTDLSKQFKKSEQVYGFSQIYDGSYVLMHTAHGLLSSRDAGATWEALKLVTSPTEVRIWSASVDPRDPNKLYYTTYGKLFLSENGGETWRNLALPSNRAPIVAEVHPQYPQLLLFGFRTVSE